MDVAPHLEPVEPITIRRGAFWITGDRVEVDGAEVQRGPMWVEWEAPAGEAHSIPIVLIHGGGGQGTDWKITPDGRPGWADRFVSAGYAVYVVDRPGHGRSPHHPAVMGEPGGSFGYAAARRVFLEEDEAAHTAWPWGREPGDAELDQFVASGGFMLRDVAAAQHLEADRIARLLDRIGPAVLVTHSAGAPSGWIAATLRPGSVRGIVAVEPQSPPWSSRSGSADLVWGISAASIAYDPPAAEPSELTRPLPGRRIPGLVDVPVLIVTGAASSYFRAAAPQMVEFLVDAGTNAAWLDLGAVGITGNGHGLIFEINSDQTATPIISWISGLQRT